MVVKRDLDAVGIVRWQHLLGAPYFRAVFVTKPLSQIHRSTFLPLQDANPTPSFGGFGLKERCVGSGKGSGRTVRIHPQEALLQRAHALQRSEGYSDYRQRRVVVEHRLARLVQLGMRQARYFGRAKTLFQLLMAATVANLPLVAGRVGMMGEAAISSWFSNFSLTLISTTWGDDIRIGWRGLLILPTSVLPSQSLFAARGFRPHF